jgi:hypothetical protein
MDAGGTAREYVTQVKDGREWRIGSSADVAWIESAITSGLEITAAIPPVFAAYGTLVLVDSEEGVWLSHEQAVVALLEAASGPQPWWLGYLDHSVGADVVFDDAPRIKLYAGWDYVLVRAGPEQALSWRASDESPAWKAALPDLIFPADQSWLLSTLWDDEWSCIGGSEALIASFVNDLALGAWTRRVALGEDVTPPGHVAR